jgi:dolichyl-phosphate beta-glucosyltransferase
MDTAESIWLSIVIPAYNEVQRISNTLYKILTYLAQQPYTAEIIVVDDGSQDATAEIVASFSCHIAPVFLLQNGQNRGKGFSVRQGFLHARGAYLLFSDADLSTPIEEVEKLFEALSASCDIAIASRAMPDSRVERHQPWYRENMGRLFNVLVRALGLSRLRDTQCGFKCFTREAALEICHRMTRERFGFDVEMLYLAYKLGHRVREVPVIWRNSSQTRVHAIRDSVSMACDLLQIRWNDLCSQYGRGPIGTPDSHPVRCHPPCSLGTTKLMPHRKERLLRSRRVVMLLGWLTFGLVLLLINFGTLESYHGADSARAPRPQ